MSFPNPYGQYHSQDEYSPSNPPTPVGFPQWETLDPSGGDSGQQQQQDVLHSPLVVDAAQNTPQGFHTVQLDDAAGMVPQGHGLGSPVDDAPILLHHPQQQQMHHHHHQQHQQHQHYRLHTSDPTPPIDALLFQAESSAPPTPGPPGTSSTATNKPSGVLRSSGRAGRVQTQSHPYYRPSTQSPMASYLGGQMPPTPGANTPAAPAPAPAKTRKPSVRFSGASGPAAKGRAASASAASPTVTVPSSSTRFASYTSSSTNSPTSHMAHSFGPATSSQGQHSYPQIQTSPQSQSHTPSSFTPTPTQQPPPPLPVHPPQTHQAPKAPSQSQAQAQPHPTHRPRLFPIPADMHYAEPTRTLHVSLEVPGVKRSHIRVKMGTCYFNKVKYVSVFAESEPIFGPLPAAGKGKERQAQGEGQGEEEKNKKTKEKTTTPTEKDTTPTPTEEDHPTPKPAHAPAPAPSASNPTTLNIPPEFTGGRSKNGEVTPDLRERKFGMMRRVIQVPSSTTPQDIDAHLEDGVLSLKIYFGEPYELDDDLEILVR